MPIARSRSKIDGRIVAQDSDDAGRDGSARLGPSTLTGGPSSDLAAARRLAKPLLVALDFEAATVDEMIDRVTVLRAQMRN